MNNIVNNELKRQGVLLLSFLPLHICRGEEVGGEGLGTRLGLYFLTFWELKVSGNIQVIIFKSLSRHCQNINHKKI